MGSMIPSMELLSRTAFAVASLVLMAMSIALVVFGVVDVIGSAAASWADARDMILSAIGHVVIAMAVFDVAKYFIEEEVIRGREMRSAGEARRSLTKFISTISIAVFIEGLVIVFRVSKDRVDQMLYPTALLLVAIFIVIGLGIYQRLSADVEVRIGQKDKAESKTKRSGSAS
jgi:L-asparagine transporter-like permease